MAALDRPGRGRPADRLRRRRPRPRHPDVSHVSTSTCRTTRRLRPPHRPRPRRQSGTAITIVSPADKKALDAIERLTGRHHLGGRPAMTATTDDGRRTDAEARIARRGSRDRQRGGRSRKLRVPPRRRLRQDRPDRNRKPQDGSQDQPQPKPQNKPQHRPHADEPADTSIAGSCCVRSRSRPDGATTPNCAIFPHVLNLCGFWRGIYSRFIPVT